MYHSRCNLLSIHFDQNLWSSCMASPSWCGNTPDRGRQALVKFCPQTATLLSVLTIGLKNVWRLAGTSASWLSMSVILCVVGYDFGSRSVMAMSLHMNLSAVFMIWVFSSPCSRLAWCSHRMLSVPSLRHSTSALLSCVVKYKVSWYFSWIFIFSQYFE